MKKLFLAACLLCIPLNASYIGGGGSGGGSGTVTSVDASVPSILTIAGNPVTTAGTLAFDTATQAANKVWCGPATGADAQPTFRALVAADIPSLPTTILTSGTLPVARGGTNSATTLNNNRFMVSSAGAVSEAAAVTASRVVVSDSNGLPSASSTTTTVLGYLDVASSLTTQLAAKAPLASPTFTGTATVATLKAGASGNCRLDPVETDIGNTGTAQSIDLSTGNVWTGTLTGNLTATFSNPIAGCPYVFIWTQDGTGSRTLTHAGVTTIWGTSGTKTLSTAASSVDKIGCVYNGNISKLMCDLAVAYQ